MKLITLKSAFIALIMLMMSCQEEDPLGPCEQLSIIAEQVGESNSYTFTLRNATDSLEFDWLINDEAIDVSNLEIEDGVWKLAFDPGTYQICIIGESPECPDGISICVTIEIGEEEAKCNEVAFEPVKQDAPGVYKFISNVEDEDASFEWYIDDELIGDSPGFLIFDFTSSDEPIQAPPGVYNVCVVVESPNCDQVREYCERIEVSTRDLCANLFFEAEQDGSNPVYTFFAAFEGKNETQYKWFIDNVEVDQENIDGTDTDHELYWQFNYGLYEVCIVNVTEGCEEQEFCKEINVNACPDLAFTYQKVSGLEYDFAADFEGISTLEYYAWLVNDELIEEEGTLNAGDNQLNYTFPEAGTYNVCIMTETQECPLGAEFCKEIVVE